MNSQSYKSILRQVAKEHGVSVAEVRRDIDAAFKEAQANPDPKVQSKWASIPRKGDTPTAAETIAYLAGKIKTDSGEN